MKFLKTYREVKDVFAPPRIKTYFGWWRHDCGFPVWRRGPIISVYRLFKNSYNYSTHQWDEEFCKKHPLFTKFIKPMYQLPIWMSFYIFDFDIMWKTKYDEIRYEYPPQFTIVILGISFTMVALPPAPNDGKNGEWFDDDGYWGGMLNYLYDCKKDIYETVRLGGYYSSGIGEKTEKRWCMRPYFFLPEHQNEYYAAISRLKETMFRNGDTILPD